MFFKVLDRDIYVREWGPRDGTPLLFLHGNPDSSELWKDIAPRFSTQFRCIAPDLPGFEKSPSGWDLDFSLAGEKDPIISQGIAKRISAAAKIIPNTGHWPMLENPDLVCTLLQDFLKLHAASSRT